MTSGDRLIRRSLLARGTAAGGVAASGVAAAGTLAGCSSSSTFPSTAAFTSLPDVRTPTVTGLRIRRRSLLPESALAQLVMLEVAYGAQRIFPGPRPECRPLAARHVVSGALESSPKSPAPPKAVIPPSEAASQQSFPSGLLTTGRRHQRVMIMKREAPAEALEASMSETSDKPGDDDLEVVEVETGGVDEDGNAVVDDLVVALDKDGKVVASDETVAVVTEDGDVIIDETISIVGDDGELHAVEEDITVLEADDDE